MTSRLLKKEKEEKNTFEMNMHQKAESTAKAQTQ